MDTSKRAWRRGVGIFVVVAAVGLLLWAALIAGVLTGAAHGAPRVGVASDPAPWRTLSKDMDFRAVYESWSKADDPAEVVARGDFLTWEPWKPVPPTTGYAVPQPAYSNAAIAAGAHDDYLRRWARAVKGTGHPYFIRYAHEMNGVWMTWSIDPAAYIRAWRHVWNVFRQEGATNARFVWSPNSNGFQDEAAFEKTIALYWPGRRYVNELGVTLVRFKSQPWTLDQIFARIARMHALYRRPVILTEVKVYRQIRGAWLRQMRCALVQTPYVLRIVWAETPSKGMAVQPWVGDMNWSLVNDATARLQVLALRRPRCPAGVKP